jgi:hypothetical protein
LQVFGTGDVDLYSSAENFSSRSPALSLVDPPRASFLAQWLAGVPNATTRICAGYQR